MGSPVSAFQKALQQLFLSSTSKHITPEFLEQVKPNRKTLSAIEAQERAAEAQVVPKRPAVESRGPATIKNYGVKGDDPTTDPIRPRPQEVISPGKKQRPPPLPDEATRPIDTSEVIPVEGLSKSQARTEELRDILKEVGIEPRLNKPESFRARGSGEGFRPDKLEAQRVTDVQTGKSFEDLSDQFAQADKEFYAENLSVPSGRALTKLRGRSPDRIVDAGGESDVGYGVGKVRVKGDKLNLTGEQQRANKELLEKTRDRIKIEGESPETRLSGDIRSEPGVVARTNLNETETERAIDLAIKKADESRVSDEYSGFREHEGAAGPRNLVNRPHVGEDTPLNTTIDTMGDLDIHKKRDMELEQDIRIMMDRLGGKENIDAKQIEELISQRIAASEADDAASTLMGRKSQPRDDFSTATEIEKQGGRTRGVAVRRNTPPLTTDNLRQTMGQDVPESQKLQQGQALRRLSERFVAPASDAQKRSRRKKAPTEAGISADVSGVDEKNIESFLRNVKPNSEELLRIQDELLGIPLERNYPAQLVFDAEFPFRPTKELTSQGFPKTKGQPESIDPSRIKSKRRIPTAEAPRQPTDIADIGSSTRSRAAAQRAMEKENVSALLEMLRSILKDEGSFAASSKTFLEDATKGQVSPLPQSGADRLLKQTQARNKGK
jgi:hypothetical protein